MKTGLIIFVLSVLPQASYASSYSLDCDKIWNIPRTLVVEPKAPGKDGFTLAAEYTTAETDAQGTVVVKTSAMIGQTDLSSDLTGTEIPVIALSEMDNPYFQVVVAKTEEVGKKVPAMQLDLNQNQVVEFNCILMEFKK